MIKGLVFDKDGTLFHYGGTWAVWCDHVLEELSGGEDTIKRVLAQAVGYDLDSKEFLAGSLIVGGAAGEVSAAWAVHLPKWSPAKIDAVALKHLQVIPSLPVCDLGAFFRDLKARGFKLGLMTNDYEEGARLQLQNEGIVDLFDFIAGFDSGHGAKPAPDPLLAFGRAVDLPMDQVAMVGDSTHDLDAGRAAGVGLNIGVLTGPAKAQWLLLFNSSF